MSKQTGGRRRNKNKFKVYKKHKKTAQVLKEKEEIDAIYRKKYNDILDKQIANKESHTKKENRVQTCEVNQITHNRFNALRIDEQLRNNKDFNKELLLNPIMARYILDFIESEEWEKDVTNNPLGPGKIDTDYITSESIINDAIIGCFIQAPYKDAKDHIDKQLWDFKPIVSTEKEDNDRCNDRFLDDYKGNQVLKEGFHASMTKLMDNGEAIMHTIYNAPKALQYGMPVISVFMNTPDSDVVIYAEYLLGPNNKNIRNAFNKHVNS